MILKPNDTILFQGDSITDAGRIREDMASMGSGYPNFIGAWLSAQYPQLNLKFINKGISGNRIYDLETRWTEECIDLKPDWVSILIGINDTWRRYDSNKISTTEDFDACYRRLLDRIKSETDAGIILLEPFLLASMSSHLTWREDLNPKIDAIRQIAREYNTLYVPLDGIFAAACAARPAEFWSADGVHPAQPGHALIAQAWIEAVSKA